MFTLPGYQLEQQLYSSAQSLVYRGRRTADNQPVVLKLLNDDYPSPERLARFRREYEMMRSLNIPGVVAAYGLEKNGQSLVMVLADQGGESLDRLLAKGAIDPAHDLELFLSLAIDLVTVLAQVHEQDIIHKDLNPSNILFNPATGDVQLIDFGIATMLAQENMAFGHPNVLEGTLAYMPPEQTGRMNRAVDYRSDFYSLGATFYELLTGQRPFLAADTLELVHAHLARRPDPPYELNPHVPLPLSDIILKLLAKNAEDRYQSAFGLKADLEECRQQWQWTRQIDPFPLGRQDVSDQFTIPQKLYGRAGEIADLLQAFERVGEGTTEIVLVSGYAGIGKSALVQELYRPLTGRRGYFIAGKFDQLQRNVPYSALIQAFRSLVRQLLTESEEEVAAWRERLLAALGPNGQVVVEVIPEVEWLIGPQAAVAPLPPTEAQNRFTLVFHNFINVFLRREHPLALFVDDLQWADAASLRLLQLIATTPNSHYLLLIGAYRDNEVGPAHPLRLTIEEIGQAGVRINSIALAPLDQTHVTQLLADTLGQSEAAEPLARLALAKTEGNPFFLKEFLKSLHANGLLRFDFQTGHWQWDLTQIQAQSITDNVVELMAGQVQRLAAETQQALKLAACVGNHFTLAAVAAVSEQSLRQTTADLQPAVAAGLIWPLNDAYKLLDFDTAGLAETVTVEYKFAHDRIQQAVYSLIPADERQMTHYRVGRLLWQKTAPEEREQRLFDIVNQLNQGCEQIDRPEERQELARLNAQAGRKAKASAAYKPALAYLQAGLELVGADGWTRCYDLTRELHVEAAEAAYLNGDFEQMEQLVDAVLQHARSVLDKVPAYEVRIQAYTAQNKLQEGIGVALSVLRLLGVYLPPTPHRAHVVRGLLTTRLRLLGKDDEQLMNLPAMTDPTRLAAVRILASVTSAAFIGAPNLYALIVFTIINLSVKYGNTGLTAYAYATYGLILCGIVGDIDSGYRFGSLALALAKQSEGRQFRAKIHYVFNGFIRHWKEPLRATLEPLLQTYQVALEVGDLEFAAYALYTHGVYSYNVGRELGTVEREMAGYGEVMAQFKQQTVLRLNQLQQQVILNLIGRSDDPCRLVGESYDEETMLPIHQAASDRTALASYHLHKFLLTYRFRDFSQAWHFADATEAYLPGFAGTTGAPQYYFFDSLTRLACFTTLARPEQKQLFKRVAANQKKLRKWAQHAPMNNLHRWSLVEAELARAQGKYGAAREYYDEAIAQAQASDFQHDVALAHELAAGFYLDRGHALIGQAYLRGAHYAYRRWGASAKVKDLEACYPDVLLGPTPGLTTTLLTTATTTASGRRSNTLDFDSILKASQAISGEIVLDRLLTKLIRFVIENAGAEKGFLLLEQEGQWVVEAAGTMDDTAVTVLQSMPMGDNLPQAIIHYVARTRENVVLDNAVAAGAFTHDDYILAHQPRSVLCAPLLNQGRLSGILYLENNLTTAAFTPERLEVLTLLSSQAAISIENARLYANLERLVEARTAELREANAILKASNAELDAFAHTVAHDLKGPVGVIVGYAEMLLEDYEGMPRADMRQDLQAIVRGGYKMRDIINALLVLASVRQQAVAIEPLDMKRILNEVQERLAYRIAQAEAIVRLPAAWPVAVGYAPWVEEVWTNYLSNAIKYGGQPPLIEVGADTQANGMVRFWVRDNGVGLTPEQRARLFTPFTRLHLEIKGYGLGLSIVQRIVEKLGGQVGVESELGQGSTFYFTLPEAK